MNVHILKQLYKTVFLTRGPVADPKGAQGTAPPPLVKDQKFSNFMQFFKGFDK